MDINTRVQYTIVAGHNIRVETRTLTFFFELVNSYEARRLMCDKCVSSGAAVVFL